MRKKGRTPTAAHWGDVGRNYIVVLFSSNVVPVMRKVSGMNDTHSPGVIYLLMIAALPFSLFR
jgi:hypothetical protein